MNKCRHCNVIVYDNTEVCPLCHSVLDEMTQEEQQELNTRMPLESPYPDVRKRTKRLQFVMRLILFLFVLTGIGLVVINRFTTPHFWWSGICIVAMIYIYLSMVYWINHDAGYAAKVGLQLILTMADSKGKTGKDSTGRSFSRIRQKQTALGICSSTEKGNIAKIIAM